MECCPEVRSPAQCNVAHVTRVISVIKYACSNHSWMQCASSMATITACCWNRVFEKSSLHGGLTAVSGDMNTVSINNNYSRYSTVQALQCFNKRGAYQNGNSQQQPSQGNPCSPLRLESQESQCVLIFEPLNEPFTNL